MTTNRTWRLLLIAVFVGIVAFTGYHAVRTISYAIYWSRTATSRSSGG